MNDTTTSHTQTEFADYDVFAAARWLGDLHNSSAKAVSLTEIEWQCRTWGSGRGRGDHFDTGMFTIIATVLNLDTWRNYDERDELVVQMPMSQFPRAATLIDHLSDNPEDWPWFTEDAEERELDVAAEALNTSADVLAANPHLLTAMGLSRLAGGRT